MKIRIVKPDVELSILTDCDGEPWDYYEILVSDLIEIDIDEVEEFIYYRTPTGSKGEIAEAIKEYLQEKMK